MIKEKNKIKKSPSGGKESVLFDKVICFEKHLLLHLVLCIDVWRLNHANQRNQNCLEFRVTYKFSSDTHSLRINLLLILCCILHDTGSIFRKKITFTKA